jgi:hypothetical protein
MDINREPIVTKPPKKVHEENNFPKSTIFIILAIELGPKSNIIFDKDNHPIKNDEMINTMIRYRLVLFLKEIDQISLSHLKKDPSQYNYFLEYEMFGVKSRMKLDFLKNYNEQKKTLLIKKLKINYFFSHSHKNVYKYLCSKKKPTQ